MSGTACKTLIHFKALADFDLTQKMPVLSIVFLALSLIVAIGLPIFLLIYVRRHYPETGQALMIGLLTFLIAEVVLLQMIGVLLNAIPAVNEFIASNESIQTLISIVLGAVLSITGVIVGLKVVSRRGITSLGGALTFAVGYIFAYVVLMCVMNLVTNLLNAWAINSSGIQSILDSAAAAENPEDPVKLMENIEEFLNASPFLFLTPVFTMVSAMMLRISASVLAYGAAAKKLRQNNYLVLAGFQLLYAASTAVMNMKLLPVAAGVVFCVLAAAGSIAYAAYMAKKNMNDEWKQLFAKVQKPQGGPGRRSGRGGNTPHKMPKIVMPKDR